MNFKSNAWDIGSRKLGQPKLRNKDSKFSTDVENAFILRSYHPHPREDYNNAYIMEHT